MSRNRNDEDEEPSEAGSAVDDSDRAEDDEGDEAEEDSASTDEGTARASRAGETPPRRTARQRQPPREVRETGTDRSDPCIMIGPSGSGKTTLLLAIGRACSLPIKDDLKLKFVAEQKTGELIKQAISRITSREQGPNATTDVQNYPFWIHVYAKPKNFWETPLDNDLYMMMSDGGGEFLFPKGDVVGSSREWHDQLIDTAQNASSLVLCVDVTKPRANVLEREMPVLLSKITKPMEVPVRVPWQQRVRDKLQRHSRPPMQMRRRRCLNVSRFLLLLTQVDKLCYKLDKPDWFASTIDPVEQARELLGVPLLNSIQSALRPGATFAIGICSAWGFHPVTGRPFADPNGRPINLAAESGDEILRRWTPFGIRDAIYFIASGKCRGTVKEVPPDGLEIADGNEPLPFSYNNFDEHAEVES